MSKEYLDYEFNNFANLLHKDCMNLMECLKKQDKDNKPILYLGKHYEKVILPYEEYQKMCNRLEAIDNAEPSEALKCLDKLAKQIELDEDTDYWEIRNAHLLVEKSLKALEIIKQKNVDVLAIKESKTLEEYNRNAWEVEHYGRYKDYKLQLTKEEFELLRSVLE